MAEKMYRAQILIYPDQYKKIRQIAERENRSISEVSRELLTYALQGYQKETYIHLDKIQAADKVSESIFEKRHGQMIELDSVELLNLTRQERTDELGSS